MPAPALAPRPTTAVWLVLGAIASVQLGATFAKQLFDEVTPTAMVWLRLGTAAVVLLALSRPRLTGRSRADWGVVLAFGTALATMNWAIYESFSRIPLGAAVTIELLGPLTVALVTSRGLRDLLWVGLAGVGVALLGAWGADVTVPGVLFALLAAASWAAYIPLSAATGRRWDGLSGLALAGVVGAVALAPAAWSTAGSDLLTPVVLGTGLLVGLLSSVVPYSLELTALRTLPPRVFGILMSLEPAAAALVAFLVLGEVLDAAAWLAMGCVVVASVGAARSTPAAPA